MLVELVGSGVNGQRVINEIYIHSGRERIEKERWDVEVRRLKDAWVPFVR